MGVRKSCRKRPEGLLPWDASLEEYLSNTVIGILPTLQVARLTTLPVPSVSTLLQRESSAEPVLGVVFISDDRADTACRMQSRQTRGKLFFLRGQLCCSLLDPYFTDMRRYLIDAFCGCLKWGTWPDDTSALSSVRESLQRQEMLVLR